MKISPKSKVQSPKSAQTMRHVPQRPRASRTLDFGLWTLDSSSAFTMIEIAISLAVIGFALVAIIGILPTGMQVQKDNRQETIINQDASVWMDAIRSGARGYDDLTNYVLAITNTVTFFQGTNLAPPPMASTAADRPQGRPKSRRPITAFVFSPRISYRRSGATAHACRSVLWRPPRAGRTPRVRRTRVRLTSGVVSELSSCVSCVCLRR